MFLSLAFIYCIYYDFLIGIKTENMKRLNDKQKENLAIFYNNLALVLLTAGAITPIFAGIGNQLTFGIKSIISLIGMIYCLQSSMKFLR